MALTDEHKIIIGVCVGVAGLVLLVIVVFVCCMLKMRETKRRYRNKDRSIIDQDVYYDRKPYTVYEKTPPPFYDPPYLPPQPPPPPVFYNHPRPLETPRFYDSFGGRGEQPRMEKRYYSEARYQQEPIVVPIAEPEVVYNDRPRAEQDVIYLKYVDDQALLPRTNYNRRTYYEPPVRRARSFTDMRNTAYVGEWNKRPDRLEFNEGAMQAGRDPFLWG
ncbi:uncharacterized protein LOC127838334 [Dreissena polymorpha]|uniref:Uncharacterized protein n=1 Tax=Dreissena polymorpha TaxID=45954 RepID=A0A9D4J637_DREPO|nr:uncharacterized protein LOC127838334 [Dreissena polymorpha]KAH3796983.1 hypothetical protein DPMN_150559 [Dreissena polymorpha]